MLIAAGTVGFETEDISVAELLSEFSQKPIATAPNKAVATAISLRIAASRARIETIHSFLLQKRYSSGVIGISSEVLSQENFKASSLRWPSDSAANDCGFFSRLPNTYWLSQP
jgi:hypothetical protein